MLIRYLKGIEMLKMSPYLASIVHKKMPSTLFSCKPDNCRLDRGEMAEIELHFLEAAFAA